MGSIWELRYKCRALSCRLDLLKPNLHLNKIPRQFKCMLRFEKYWLEICKAPGKAYERIIRNCRLFPFRFATDLNLNIEYKKNKVQFKRMRLIIIDLLI